MADDARTEARRRIALATHRLICSGCTDAGCVEMDEADWDVADAVLDLFPQISWNGTAWPDEAIYGAGSEWVYRRRLRLDGAWEADPEHPDPPKPEDAWDALDDAMRVVLGQVVEPVVPEGPRAVTPDPDSVLCAHRWDHNASRGGHMCVEFGPHTTHRCCCGAEEPQP